MKVKKLLFLLPLLGLCNCSGSSMVSQSDSPTPYYYTHTRDEMFIQPEWERRRYGETWEYHRF